jgi:hydrogenase maturation protein HypF
MEIFFIQVEGIVQGVGFRPFVYNLALKHKINGWVNNDDRGVNILLYTCEEKCQNFIKELQENPPILAKINSINIEKITEIKEYKSFEIIQSTSSNNKSTIISADMSICDDCIEDINDMSNFRYNYSLTNCTNCGPRYSIIKTVPYDRINTSMNIFILCENCAKEYNNPTNRRYHAQPVSCEVCGPNVTLYNKYDEILESNINAIEKAADLINKGFILAIKGMGGFHLVCDASNNKTVEQLRINKNRPSKPYAVMFKDIMSIKTYTNINQKEEETLCSKEKPIVLVKKKDDFSLSKLIAPNINQIGCFIAYTPLHHLLFRYLKNPIIATSANLKDEPIITSKNEVLSKLSLVVDYILDFNRDILNTCDDSVIQIVENCNIKLRNARGYAPTSLKLEKTTNKKILGLGANQKSTISLAFENNIILSPHIGDLNSIESVEYFERTINTFKRFYDFEPDIIVCDKHPNYESTKFAFKLKEKNPNIQLIQIQHHYAHILSTMAEYNLQKDVLGIAFDGTGYGDDGNIWGGEVFIANTKEYKRVNHISYFKLLGGEMAVKEPKRVALSLLFDNFSLEYILSMDIACVKAFKINEIKMLHTMWQKGLNAPLTSSVGRLFDAIASFADILHTQSYEGETGLHIEQNYDSSINEYYSYKITNEQIDLSSMIKEIILDLDKKLICSKFINTIVQIILDLANTYENLPVVLSGGVFQNKTLLQILIGKFQKQGREFFFSKDIPLNDGGISVGQIYHKI